ncbi:common central domain of tyrosinase-domain-containing protein [Kalaharituber pfeilii]|nr:common central domain of tyrosinase-domain-containing protein [Kalaharituber pfeilii]
MSASNDDYPITGIVKPVSPPPSSPIPLRYEIDEWSQKPENKPQVDLFLLALDQFQKLTVYDQLSYFQVCGIHGLPLVPWGENLRGATPNEGYCNHNSTLFPTWHRPYVLLFEQRIHEIMLDIAKEYPKSEREKYQKAAETWRLPYWDWAELKSRPGQHKPIYDIPLLVKPPTVIVLGPEGPVKLDPNPLARFLIPEFNDKGEREKFGQLGYYSVNGFIDGKGIPYAFNIATSTSRYLPEYNQNDASIKQKWVDGYVDDNAVTKALNGPGDPGDPPYSLREWVWRIFHTKTYDKFATTLVNVDGQPVYQNIMSLEGVHNSIHDRTGGPNGHMAWVPVAAFDPIFWLHHANVDRLFAIWQTLFPDAWFSDRSQQLIQNGNFYLPPLTKPSPETKLHPFRAEGSEYHTSNSIRDWFRFGYSYPELQPWLDKYKTGGHFDERKYRHDVQLQIKKLYAPVQVYYRKYTPVLAPPTTEEDNELTLDDYIAEITYNRYELNGGEPYRIYIFVGPKEDQGSDSSNWAHSKVLVGTLYTFSNPTGALGPEDGRCGNCVRQSTNKALSRVQIPLIHGLIKRLEKKDPKLGSYKPEVVVGYLREHLHWAAARASGTEIPLKDLPSLRVAVLAGKATHSFAGPGMSRYEDYHVEHGITKDREGGYAVPE